MDLVTDAGYLVTHTAELRVVIVLLTAVAALSAIMLAEVIGHLARTLQQNFVRSGVARRYASHLDAVGAR